MTVVCTASPGSDEWLEARRAGIGASEIAALFGASPWMTELDLWQSKHGLADPFEVTEVVQWGIDLEALILEKHAQRHGLILDRYPDVPSILAHPEHPEVRASLDGLLHGPQATVVAEAKNTHQWRAWADDQTPPYYWMQCQWQLLVTGLEQAHLVALIRGNELVYRVIEADHDWQDMAMERALSWWHTHILDGRMPDPDPLADASKLASLWEPDITASAEIPEKLLGELVEWRSFVAEAKTILTEFESQVKTHMNEACSATLPGGRYPVVTWKPGKPRRTVAVADVERLAPDLAESLIRVGKPSRSLLIKPTKPEDEGDEE